MLQPHQHHMKKINDFGLAYLERAQWMRMHWKKWWRLLIDWFHLVKYRDPFGPYVDLIHYGKHIVENESTAINNVVFFFINKIIICNIKVKVYKTIALHKLYFLNKISLCFLHTSIHILKCYFWILKFMNWLFYLSIRFSLYKNFSF